MAGASGTRRFIYDGTDRVGDADTAGNMLAINSYDEFGKPGASNGESFSDYGDSLLNAPNSTKARAIGINP